MERVVGRDGSKKSRSLSLGSISTQSSRDTVLHSTTSTRNFNHHEYLNNEAMLLLSREERSIEEQQQEQGATSRNRNHAPILLPEDRASKKSFKRKADKDNEFKLFK